MILCFLLINILLLAAANDDRTKTDKEEPVENVISEKETSSQEESEKTYVEEDQNQFKQIRINTLKVVQDNVSGNKHNSFSEDLSSNRGDESTIADIKREAEKLLEEKGMLQADSNDLIHEDIHEETYTISDNKNSKTESVIGNLNEEVLNLPDETTVNSETKSETIENKILETARSNEPVEKKLKGEVSMQEDINEPIDAELLLPKSTVKRQVEAVEETVQNQNYETGDSQIADRNDDSSLYAKSDTNAKPPVTLQDRAEQQEHLKTKNQEIEAKQNIESTSHPTEGKMQNQGSSLESEEKRQALTAGDELYKEAVEYLSANNKDLKKAYKLFSIAADNNHTKSMENVAYPYLFGDYGLKRNISKAVNIFQHLADAGSPVGQQGLGFIYGAGLSVNSSQAKSLIYTTFSALGGDTMAQMMLGYRYISGIGVAQSCEAALTYYKKVAKKVSDETTSYGGNAIQRVRLYDELEQPGSSTGHIDDDLLQYYQFLADKGDLSAQMGLGQLYFQGGRGVDVNYAKAFKYFSLVGNEGNGNGLAYLGKMYMEGLYVEKDIKKAYEHFKKAAEQKNPVAQAGLGVMYLNGIGVKKDYDAAKRYFSQAAEQGWVEGQLQLGQMYYNGVGVKKDYRQAVKYFTFASQAGHVLAFYNLATMHATGAGVMRSCHTATELFKNVAERGHWSVAFMDAYDAYKSGDIETALLKYYFLAELGYEIAQSNVAYILDKGDIDIFSVNQTYARALLQWSRAAHQGYSVARVKVGDYHYYGMGTKIDYEAAALHYRLASDQQNNPQALFNLGYMHEQGFGLKQDIHLAKRFYDMAAEANVDAHFPVYIALAKLAIYFTWEWILENYRFWERIDLDSTTTQLYKTLGPEWDVYIITLLSGLLLILLLFRRIIRN